MTISESFFPLISVILLGFYILMFFLGYRKGIVRALIDLVGTIAAVWLSWTIAPVFSDFAHLWPREWTPLQDTAMAGAVYQFANEVFLFLLVFILLKVVIALIEYIARGIEVLPGIHMLSGILGGVFQIVVAVVWTLILTVFLSLPIFTNGNDAIDHSLLGTVRDIANVVSDEYIAPFMDSEAFGELFENAGELQDDSREAIRGWLEDHGYDTEHIDEAAPQPTVEAVG